jgi:general secretion pathway protein M
MSVGSAIAEFWAGRSSRERAILLGAIALAVALALYLFLWEPGLAARTSLAVALPRLRAQLEDMRRQGAEIALLRRKLGAAPRRGDVAELVRASLVRASFAKSGVRVDALPNGGALLRGEDVIFDAWLDWAASLQRELGVRIDACTISSADQPGRVQVQARFMAAGSAR